MDYRLLHSTFWNIEKVWFLVCFSFFVPVYLSTHCWSSTSFQIGIDQCFLNLAAWIAFYFVNTSCAAIISWVSMWTYIFLVVWYNLAVRSWISVAQLRHCSCSSYASMWRLYVWTFLFVNASAYRRPSSQWYYKQQFGRVPLLPATWETRRVGQSQWFSATGVFRATVRLRRRCL